MFQGEKHHGRVIFNIFEGIIKFNTHKIINFFQNFKFVYSLTKKFYWLYLKDSTYKFCINANPDSYLFEKMEKMKIKITLENYSDLKDMDLYEKDNLKKDDIFEIDNSLAKVHSKVIDIMRTQNYQLSREDEFTNKQITNSKVLMYLTIIQIILIVFFTICQILSLKKMFIKLIKWDSNYKNMFNIVKYYKLELYRYLQIIW